MSRGECGFRSMTCFVAHPESKPDWCYYLDLTRTQDWFVLYCSEFTNTVLEDCCLRIWIDFFKCYRVIMNAKNQLTKQFFMPRLDISLAINQERFFFLFFFLKSLMTHDSNLSFSFSFFSIMNFIIFFIISWVQNDNFSLENSITCTTGAHF